MTNTYFDFLFSTVIGRIYMYEHCVGILEESVKLLKLALSQLAELELYPDIGELLDFDPWYILKREKRRIVRFRNAVAAVEEGTARRPKYRLEMIDDSLFDKIRDIKKIIEDIEFLRWVLSDMYGEEAERALDRVYYRDERYYEHNVSLDELRKWHEKQWREEERYE